SQIAGLPLDAELAGIVFADFDDEAFDDHLGTALVEQVDDLTQAAVERVRSRNEQGIGGGIGLYRDARCGERGALGIAQSHGLPSSPRRRGTASLCTRAGAAAPL